MCHIREGLKFSDSYVVIMIIYHYDVLDRQWKNCKQKQGITDIDIVILMSCPKQG